jgi:hypothetical protein
MNELEEVLEGSGEDLDWYLENVKTENFKKDIDEIKAKTADQEIVKRAIKELQKLLKDAQ